MLNRKTITIVSLFVFLVFASSSCSPNLDAPAPVGPNPPGSSQNSGSENKIAIKSIDGKLVAEIGSDGQIEFIGKKLTSKRKSSEKVKYSIDGNEIAEVKAKDTDGFKVRDLNGNLLWKVKITSEKIKISDNEENANPYEIKKTYDGAKIKRNDEKLGEFKFDSKNEKVKIKDASENVLFESRTSKQSAAFGVLLLVDIPEELRFVIMSELFSRNL